VVLLLLPSAILLNFFFLGAILPKWCTDDAKWRTLSIINLEKMARRFIYDGTVYSYEKQGLWLYLVWALK
jgi:hypothetical protein